MKFGARLTCLATWLGMLAAGGGMLPFFTVGALVSSGSAAFAAPRTQSAPPVCAPGWEQGFPAEGTVYTDPLTGCTGVYEIVIGDRVVVPGRGAKEVTLEKSSEFPNRLCWATTARFGHSVEHCDSYTITGGATVGAGGGVTVGADAGVVFASAKAEMEVTYTAEFTVGGGWTGSKCETYSWEVESPHPSCCVLTYRVFAAKQPTWAEARRDTRLTVRFINECEINGSMTVHNCLTVTRANLLGEQAPVEAPGAGWTSRPIIEDRCPCAPQGGTACIERPRIFAVGGSGWKFGLSIEEWAGGVGAGCDMDWVDRVLPDLEPIIVVEEISE
jgi:hypothetical protein